MAADHNDEFEDDIDGVEAPVEETFSDENVADEDWDSYDDQQSDDDVPDDLPDDQAMDNAPRKKSGNFNKILIGVAVLVGAGLLVLQLGKGAPTPTADTAPPPVAAPAEPEESAGLLTSPQGMAQLQDDIAKKAAAEAQAAAANQPKEASDVAVPPMPVAMTAPAAEPAPVAPTDALPVPASSDVLPVPASGAAPALETPARIPMAQDMMLNKAEAPAAPAATPAPVDTTERDALKAELATAQARADGLESELKSLREKAERDSASIATLEQKLAAKNATPEPAVSPLPPETPKIEPKILGSAENEPVGAPTAVAAPAENPVVAKPARTTAPAAAASSVSTSWV